MNASLIITRLALLAGLLGLSPQPASGQVTFIDKSTFAAQLTNAPPREQAVRLSVAVLRFLPKDKSGRFTDVLPTNAPLDQIVAALGKLGQVNLLYLGDRDLAGATNATARFDSAERRPAFSLNAEANQSLTNRHFGLHLEIAARPAAGGQMELNWDGSFSWSPSLIDTWAGEKYLMFGMQIAKLLKPGAVYSDDDEDSGTGINIGGLFKKKPKETKPTGALDLSFLVAERQEVILKGRQLVRAQELNITAVPTPNADPKQPEFLLLFLHYSLAD